MTENQPAAVPGTADDSVAPGRPVPDVSVIVGAYDAMPYLVRCLESVAAQTIGPDRMELIAVDDGSTDGTGERLAEFAARGAVPTRVVRQANSGSPGGPRNTGLGLARGRYVFFLDADDYLGDEALERLVAMADRAGTDVVLGRTVGVNRGAARSMWRKTTERADIYTSNVKFTLSAQKLFRRELLVRHRMRFDPSLRIGEDALFTMEAYLRAAGVSVVADYTCYYLVGRADGKHVTRTVGHPERIAAAGALMELIAAHLPPGERRDRLMVRPFTVNLLPQFGPIVLRRPVAELRRKLELAAPLMAAHWTPGVAALLRVPERLPLTCVALDRPAALLDVVAAGRSAEPPPRVRRGGREYLAYPHFGDPAAGIPDEAYEVLDAPGRLGRLRRRARRAAVRLVGQSRLSRLVRLVGQSRLVRLVRQS
ncbi:glycosyltransferase [Streptomyces sp. LP05-1]|uniref:Glycosyltransferase n=1 Tax=Streptomyces pyxinae TaxID=2970734 RepID=A0ABT2CL43_9ACTN|nr:glycosyltransferase [Streptomyces sp. LP05-1]MCS0638122.1 glycosyltransferase [Streptomyces sp. LP05-1]